MPAPRDTRSLTRTRTINGATVLTTNADLDPGASRTYRGYLISRSWPTGEWFFVTRDRARIATTETLAAALAAIDSLYL